MRGGRKGKSRRPATSEGHLLYILATCLRDQSVFLRARELLQEEHFIPGTEEHNIVWQATKLFYARHGALPSQDELRTEALGLLAVAGGEYDEEAIQRIVQQLYAFRSLNPRVALGWLKTYLEDRLADRIARDVGQSDLLPEDLISTLRDYEEQAGYLKTLVAEAVSLPFPNDWQVEEDSIPVFSTGVHFLDQYLGGGHAKGEAHVIIGPYGSGKTTLAIQLSACSALLLFDEWEKNGRKGPCPRSYLVLYEDDIRLARLRALSALAEVPFTTLSAKNPQLSTSSSLKDYEKRMFAELLEAGHPVPGEKERIAIWSERLNRNWRVIDLSGTEGRVGVGSGLQDEVAAVISADLDAAVAAGQECCVGVVVLDYVLASVRRHMDAKAISKEHMRHYINEYPLRMKDRVLRPFNCPGWLFHQADSTAQRFSPGQIASHMHSAEGKGIGEAANFCFNIGRIQQSDGRFLFSCSKARRVKPQEPCVLGINDQFTRIEETEGYRYDPRSGKIVRAVDLGDLEEWDDDIKANVDPDTGLSLRVRHPFPSHAVPKWGLS